MRCSAVPICLKGRPRYGLFPSLFKAQGGEILAYLIGADAALIRPQHSLLPLQKIPCFARREFVVKSDGNPGQTGWADSGNPFRYRNIPCKFPQSRESHTETAGHRTVHTST